MCWKTHLIIFLCVSGEEGYIVQTRNIFEMRWKSASHWRKLIFSFTRHKEIRGEAQNSQKNPRMLLLQSYNNYSGIFIRFTFIFSQRWNIKDEICCRPSEVQMIKNRDVTQTHAASQQLWQQAVCLVWSAASPDLQRLSGMSVSLTWRLFLRTPAHVWPADGFK